MRDNTATKDKTVGLREKLGFGAFSVSLDAGTNFISTFFLFFLTDVLGITPALAGTVLLLGTVWDAVNDPLIGFYSTNRRFKNGETARPYAKWFALPTAAVFVLLFTAFDASPTLRFIYAVAVYLLYNTFVTFLRIPVGSMPTLASAGEGDRISINTFMSGGSSIGVVLATLGCWPLINLLSGVNDQGALVNPRFGFFWGAVVAAVIFLIGPIFHYLTSRERVKPMEESTDKIGSAQVLKMLLSSREWVNNTLYMLFYNFTIMFVTASIVYYATYVLRDANGATILLGAYILASLGALPFVGAVHRRIGRKKTMMLSALVLILSKAYFVLNPASLLAAVLNGVFMGVGVSFSIVAMNTNRAEIADLIEWNGGRRIENMISAMSSMISKLGLALSNFTIGLILEMTGYHGDLSVQPDAALKAINAFMGLIPMILAVFMLIVAARSKIVEATDQMNREKALRK